jgi:hypothetical protein
MFIQSLRYSLNGLRQKITIDNSYLLVVITFNFLIFSFHSSTAQTNVPDSTFKPVGKLWGLAFGDYYYKAHADLLNRGGSNQYTNIEKGRNAFQFRRVYLGYNYELSAKFSAELVLAAEDNVNVKGVSSGDLLSNNKLSFYIKQANLRWKNIWKGTDLVLGQSATPVFPMSSEQIWGYRSIERTIADIRRTPSSDMGISLQGKFDPDKGNYGYNLMIANGTGAKPENDKYKWFYSDVYAKLFDKKILVDLYADYQRLNWSPTFHHSRNMVKGLIAYTSTNFNFGVEGFINNGKSDISGTKGTVTDTLNAKAKGLSLFARGVITQNKLGYFARFDTYNPYSNYSDGAYSSYKGFTSSYDPNNKEQFITAGLDFTPMKNVHFMPNIWYNRYNAQPSNSTGASKHDYDLVYRASFYFQFGR